MSTRNFVSILLTATLTTLLMPGVAQTSANEVEELYSQCQAVIQTQDGLQLRSERAVDGLRCTAYLRGFSDANAISANPSFCPVDFTIARLARIYVQYVDQNPSVTGERIAAKIVLSALTNAYPCVQTKSLRHTRN